LAIALLLSLAGATPAFADLLNLTSVTPGSSGSFTGTLDGVTVNGSISATTPNFVFNPSALTPNFNGSSVDATSPQYSYSSVYAVTAPLADQVGYTTLVGTANPATITINFGSAIVNPIFQVANLDGMRYDFSPTAPLGLVLLSGNGGADGDGILVTGDVISDANTNTIVGVDPGTTPPLTGARSAYGSVELMGSFTTLTIDVSNPGDLGDGGSFTLAASPVPEPWSVTLFGTLCAFFLFHLRRRAGAVK
jgi:hypothetical protein